MNKTSIMETEVYLKSQKWGAQQKESQDDKNHES